MNPIVKMAASALPGEKKYVLFAGAGVSKDAGMPTAWDLMLNTASLLYAAENEEMDPEPGRDQIQAWFLNSVYANMQYAQLMDLIYPHSPDQQEFLKKFLGGRELGKAHQGIAELARRGIIRAIVTTNFDHCIEKALEEKGLDTQVISTDEDLEGSEPLIHCRSIRIYKPHGDLGRGNLKNTPSDLEKLSPKMEEELIRVLTEHGVIILGYAGRDKGIQEILKRRKSTYYPLFWVDPCRPDEEIETILKPTEYTYIPCMGAGQFIDDYLKLLERLEGMAPSIGLGPSIYDIRRVLSSANQPVEPLFKEFLKNIYRRLQATKPDFTQFAERDEAIIQQINEGLHISYDFIEAALEAAKHKNLDAIKKLYEFFGEGLRLYNVPDDFSGSYDNTDFDGYKFLLQEMFVSFISVLIKYDHWDVIPNLLEEGLLVNKKHEGGYVSFRRSCLSSFFDTYRNARLDLRRTSLTADILEQRFRNTRVSDLIEFEEYMEADYFIFLHSLCHMADTENYYHKELWFPFSSIHMNKNPRYIVKSESKRFLEILAKVSGCTESNAFIDRLRISSRFIHEMWPHTFYYGPLENYNFEKLGTWP